MRIPPRLGLTLNTARWIGAFAVVLGHARHLLLANLPDTVGTGLGVKAFYFFSGFGHEAVVVFFVLSGLLVGGVTFDKWQRSGPDLHDYFVHRFSRIYATLVPALAVGALLDFIGWHYLNASHIYTEAASIHTTSMDDLAIGHLGVGAALGNLLMLENVTSLVRPLGSNEPLWSLSWEWWYYCLFALLAGCGLAPQKGVRIACAAAAAGLALWLPGKTLAWMSIWAFGIGALWYGHSALWKPKPALAWGLFVVALAASRLLHNQHNMVSREPMLYEYLRDFGVGLTFALVLASLAKSTDAVSARVAAWSERLAGFSYTLYLTHFPMLVFVAAGLHDLAGIAYLKQPGVGPIVECTLLVALLYAYARVFAAYTEARTGKVRAWLLGVTASGPAAATARAAAAETQTTRAR
jgi:peptidoglycan/LPS O-acetylase OafA/YrhL